MENNFLGKILQNTPIQKIDKRGAVLVKSGLGTLGHCLLPLLPTPGWFMWWSLAHTLGIYETQFENHHGRSVSWETSSTSTFPLQ